MAAKVLIHRVMKCDESGIDENQCGLKNDKNYSEQIFVAR